MRSVLGVCIGIGQSPERLAAAVGRTAIEYCLNFSCGGFGIGLHSFRVFSPSEIIKGDAIRPSLRSQQSNDPQQISKTCKPSCTTRDHQSPLTRHIETRRA